MPRPYFGKLTGTGEATRTGTHRSGLAAILASPEGSVRVELRHEHGRDVARVSLEPWEGAGVSRVLYEGPVAPGSIMFAGYELCHPGLEGKGQPLCASRER